MNSERLGVLSRSALAPVAVWVAMGLAGCDGCDNSGDSSTIKQSEATVVQSEIGTQKEHPDKKLYCLPDAGAEGVRENMAYQLRGFVCQEGKKRPDSLSFEVSCNADAFNPKVGIERIVEEEQITGSRFCALGDSGSESLIAICDGYADSSGQVRMVWFDQEYNCNFTGKK